MMCGADEKICPGPIRRPDWTVTLFDVFDLQEVDSKINAQNRWSLRCFCSQNLQLVQGQRWTQGNQVFVEILHQLRWNHEVGEFDLLTSMKWCSIYCFGMIWSTSKIIFCQFLFWGRPNCIFYLILKLFPLIDVKYEKGEMFDILTQSFLYYKKYERSVLLWVITNISYKMLGNGIWFYKHCFEAYIKIRSLCLEHWQYMLMLFCTFSPIF